MSMPFIAEIRIFGFNYPPRSWSFCDGQIIPIDENQALFALIGDIYGGDARVTMGLPNLQGRSPLQTGKGPGLTQYRLADYGGLPEVQLATAQIPYHTHTLYAARQAGTTPEPSDQLFAYQAGDAQPDYKQPPLGDLEAMSPGMLTYTGLSSMVENRQPFLGLSFCIALEGIFPPRN
ncbi:tail fiber protein [Hahella aquimaris]|uniref:phage tail protein n=1 Tax=Hahella sp. HNIBRBA332 TaxID=3015983 RepID=UPI00273AFE55|nr:tail fiber protein [Hahella sp. HNIBRBA332]WLQ13950.1 tail fiber protein [Hahella sp. HNIBRBA332]